MTRIAQTRIAQAICLSLALASTATVFAESKNPADYPLRVHVFSRSETNYHYNRTVEETKGEGRANLFANGEVHGVDFSFDCGQKIKDSFGYETYPAKWKKPGQELVVLMPVFGKTGAFFTCNFKTDVKNDAYITRNGHMTSEPSAEFKTWMTKHEYDPEHDKNTPMRLTPPPAPSASTPPAAPQQ